MDQIINFHCTESHHTEQSGLILPSSELYCFFLYFHIFLSLYNCPCKDLTEFVRYLKTFVDVAISHAIKIILSGILYGSVKGR